jgi:hypothetical protein
MRPVQMAAFAIHFTNENASFASAASPVTGVWHIEPLFVARL